MIAFDAEIAVVTRIMSQSILKNSTRLSPTVPDPPLGPSLEERHRETALYHARLLQQRKDTESVIFASIEALLDMPTSHSADPAHPSLPDRIDVTQSLKIFQPSDFDTLIDERNINDLCGYVLCPRPNKKQDTKANFRILHGSDKAHHALNFVPRQSLEKWCSNECGKRALYLKVQLNEEPSWTRLGPSTEEIILLDDRQSGNEDSEVETDVLQKMSDLDLSNGEETNIEGMKERQPTRENLHANGTFQTLKFVDGDTKTNSRLGSIESCSPNFPREDAERDCAVDEDMLKII